MACILGVDVGGTNTDAVLLQGTQVLSFTKRTTTSDVTSGVIQAVYDVLKKVKGVEKIQQVNIGTTHFVNAVVQRSPELSKVAVIRLAKYPYSRAAPPFADFPESLKNILCGGLQYVSGGYEFDGREVGQISRQELIDCSKNFISKGIRNFVICGTFSAVKTDQEDQAADILLGTFGDDISITISHQIGRLGIMERENAAILNESLKGLCKKIISGLTDALETHIGLTCPVFLAQNDGTICSVAQALQYPIFTFASGPTNSMRGAAFISGVKNAVVVDIGGTTTDVGVLVDGFPRPASSTVEIGGVPTNFRMPHTYSIGLGGGSTVNQEENGPTIGPKSVGYRLKTEALCFGGETLTATDIAVVSGMVPDIDRNAFDLQNKTSRKHVSKSLSLIREKIEESIDRMKTTSEEVDVVLVGGGSVLVDTSTPLKGCKRNLSVQHSAVANAIGAALCQVSAHVDHVTSLEPGDQQARYEAIERIKAQVKQLAVKNGAIESSVELVDFEEVPLSYIPGNAIRYKAKAVGDLNINSEKAANLKFPLPELKLQTDLQAESYKRDEIIEDALECFPSTETCENDQPWVLNAGDIECIAIGAGILGCGGGGNPHMGKIRLLQQLKEGKAPTVVSLQWLLNQGATKGCIGAGYIGAPIAQYERPPSGNEPTNAVQVLARLLADSTFADSLKHEKTPDGEAEFTDYAVVPQDLDDKSWLEKVCSAVMPFEIGGLNSATPLSVSADLNIPCLDADCMGRAFPELQMFTTAIYGFPVAPTVQAADSGRVTICHWGKSPKIIEDFDRNVCIENGCSGGCSMFPVPVDKIREYCILGSISRAWRLGKAVLEAKLSKSSPVDAVLSCEGGLVICAGKISELARKVEGGFSRGHVIIDSTNERFSVAFQNENTVAWRIKNEKKEAIVSVPDLICILNEEDGTPITTEELRYGLRVVVLGLPADPLLTTEKALKVVGPKAFGYPDVTFRPIK